MFLSSLFIAFHMLPSVALLMKAPQKSQSLIEHQQGRGGVKLIPSVAKKQWLQKKHSLRVHMLAEPAEEELQELAVEGCIACRGLQVVYGKYKTEEGDRTDNSYFLFKDPAVQDSSVRLPIVIQFHPGGFFSGEPWRVENDEIKSYLSMGFAVVSVGYRMVTEKYFYEDDLGNNMTEELIHVSKDGNLTLDTTGQTMDNYQVRVGKQEFITKFLYDATEVIESLIRDADKFGLDVDRIVFVGESSGGAAMQYLTWVYHQWNIGRYTPRGIVYHNAQLNYPVNNMLGATWELFADTMGPQVKLSDVVSAEACPSIVGNHMCGSTLGNTSDYELCNEEWNERSLKEFCGEALKAATLEQARKRQVWPAEDDVGKGMEKLWYASENMQRHLPSDPFYIYVANSMNGTGPVEVSHHSVFALNFAKFAEMGQHGGHQYTAYYTDFAHMTDADRGMQRLEVTRAPPSLALPPAAAAPPVPAAPSAVVPPASFAPAPGPAPGGPAPAPGPAFEIASPMVFNYLSTHGWREDVAEARDIEAASMEERVLYASFAVGIGPFAVNKTSRQTEESRGLAGALPRFGVAVLTIMGMLISGF